MDELITRIVDKTGLGAEAAKKSVSVLVSFLDKNAPSERMTPFYAAVPEAKALVAKPKGGLIAGLGGGLIGAYNELAAAGLSTTQMRQAGEEILAFAREKAGNDAVEELVASVPMLRQLM